MNKILFLITKVVPVLGSIKSAIFSDGKFHTKRALILLGFTVVLSVGVYVIGVEGMQETMKLLGEVSDSIGYVD